MSYNTRHSLQRQRRYFYIYDDDDDEYDDNDNPVQLNSTGIY
jgi:hypothetical protein